MGKVAAVYNLMPDDVDVRIEGIADEIKGAIPDGVEVAKMEVRPVAFGLRMLTVTFIMNDAGAIVDNLEDSLQRIKGVQSIECVSVTLI